MTEPLMPRLPSEADQEPIRRAIPHRPPFLFADRIVERDERSIRTEYLVRDDDIFVTGHYPGNPIMPGVLVCEAILQAGALLMSQFDGPGETATHGAVPVLSRLADARFRKVVRPGDLLEIEVELVERAGNAVQMRGAARVGGATAVRLSFTSALVDAGRLG